MIVLLHTATPTAYVSIIGDARVDSSYQADRELAKTLLGFLRDELAKQGASFTDVTGYGIFRGPGSFTGLRIGMTVLNTLASASNVPIVGTIGDDWQKTAIKRLKSGENDQIVTPEYGAPATITTPR